MNLPLIRGRTGIPHLRTTPLVGVAWDGPERRWVWSEEALSRACWCWLLGVACKKSLLCYT